MDVTQGVHPDAEAGAAVGSRAMRRRLGRALVWALVRTAVRAVLVPVLVLLLVPALGGSWAAAHEGHSGTTVVVDGLTPAISGVSVRSVPGGVGKLALDVDGVTATVLGDSGEPLFRVGPSGVEANAAAPGWYQVNEPLGIATIPPEATAGAPPRWVRVAVEPSWAWFDHRLHPAGSDVTDWSIPVEVDGQGARITGRVQPTGTRLAMTLDVSSVPDELEVSVIDQPTLAIKVRSRVESPVQVLGGDGEVFAQLTGAQVLVNRRSPVWASMAQVASRDLLGAVVDPSAPADLVSAGPTADLIWPDPRLAPSRPTESVRWSIPVVLQPGAQPVVIQGTTAPIALEEEGQASGPGDDDSGFPTAQVAIAAAATLLLVGAAAATRRR